MGNASETVFEAGGGGWQADTDEQDQANSQHYIKEGRSDNACPLLERKVRRGSKGLCAGMTKEKNKTKTTHQQQSCALPVAIGWFEASGNSVRQHYRHTGRSDEHQR